MQAWASGARNLLLAQVRPDDPPFFEELELTDEERLQLRAEILYRLMLDSFVTNYRTRRAKSVRWRAAATKSGCHDGRGCSCLAHIRPRRQAASL